MNAKHQTSSSASTQTVVDIPAPVAPFFARKAGRPALAVRTGVHAGVASQESDAKRR
jgi:hypothetical protein